MIDSLAFLQSIGLGDVDIRVALAVFGLALGVAFGAIGQSSRFCVRRAAIESARGRPAPMAGAFALALATALVGTQALSAYGLIDLSTTRFFGDSLPLGALAIGGSLFGAGMALSRGCASRLLVLSAQGNLRAALTMLIFAVVAFAAMKGALAPLRLAIMDFAALPAPATLPEALGLNGAYGPALIVAAVAALAVWIARKSGAGLGLLAAGVGVGALVAAGWFVTGALVVDEFDPLAAESLAFTAPTGDALLYVMTSTGATPGFGVGFVGGLLLGSFASAALRRELRAESFESPAQTGRYLLGGAMMGAGGVLAGGCTIGAGLTGVSTLAVGPMIALAFIILGARVAATLLARDPLGAAIVAAE